MNNLDLYKKAFVENFKIELNDVENSKYKETTNWDSVGHINLVTTLEETFDIMMEPDDIIDFNSFENGKVILNEKYDVEF